MKEIPSRLVARGHLHERPIAPREGVVYALIQSLSPRAIPLCLLACLRRYVQYCECQQRPTIAILSASYDVTRGSSTWSDETIKYANADPSILFNGPLGLAIGF